MRWIISSSSIAFSKCWKSRWTLRRFRLPAYGGIPRTCEGLSMTTYKKVAFAISIVNVEVDVLTYLK